MVVEAATVVVAGTGLSATGASTLVGETGLATGGATTLEATGLTTGAATLVEGEAGAVVAAAALVVAARVVAGALTTGAGLASNEQYVSLRSLSFHLNHV